MGDTTHIAWCDATFNPVWGCTKVSPGCKFCYAEGMSKRTGRDVWGPQASRWRTGADNWRKPLKWNKQAAAEGKRLKVFCASMADVFEDHPDWLQPRKELWRLIEATPHLDWLLLTKRPENIARFQPPWPWPDNVWLGTSVEDQRRAEERIPHLLAAAASVRFLSCEPLLGRVDLRPYLYGLQWVIVGGESGAKHRPMQIEWAQDIREQCAYSCVSFFAKQPAHRLPGQFHLLPPDLQVQEFPA